MKPKLVVITGSVRGDEFELSEQTFSIGRHGDNRLRVNHAGVSRFHCTIGFSENAFQLQDLESRHGTRINGEAVKTRVLVHGDLIEVGDARLLFLNEENQSMERPEALPSGPHEATASIPIDRVIYLDRRRMGSELALQGSAGSALNALFEISRQLAEERDLEKLVGQIFRQILATLPVRRVALVLNGTIANGESWFTDCDGNRKPFPLSSGLLARVARERQGLLYNHMVHEETLAGSESLLAQRVGSLVIAPLLRPGHRLGILYADSGHGKDLNENHLELMTAIACVAAAPLLSALQNRQLERENSYLRETVVRHEMIGQCPAMTRIYRFIGKVAPTPSTVLIRGESGTGKELAARAIHASSSRAKKPFIAVNCAVLSKELLSSELFGHERGAFTGAVATKIGKLEVADGGTLFLDEVGELPPAIQAKLLRVLQEREFERVGGNRTLKIDVRLIAATNRDLEEAIRSGHFREDLFYRLNVISMVMPPLRERRSDIVLLAEHFANKHASAMGRPVPELSKRVLACLKAYDWPGNVRELSNALERALVLMSDGTIHREDLPEALTEGETNPNRGEGAVGYRETLDELKRKLVLDAIEQSAGNITRAAELLQLHPNYLHRLIGNLDLRDQLKSRFSRS